MVGRYDGYQEEETKLKDAIKLLEAKQTLLDNYTQQIIGLGLRLPFGQHISKEAVNTLEIIMHDNFQELLNVRKSLKNKFFGLREEDYTEVNKSGEQPENYAPQPPEENNSSQS